MYRRTIMKDTDKTKEQLVNELVELRQRTTKLEALETERKRAQERLKQNEAMLAEAQHIAHIGSWELDIISNTLTWSDEVYRMFGLKPQQFGATYEAFLDNIHPDDREMVNEAYNKSVETKTPYDIVHRLLLKDGTIKYVNERCKTSYNHDGKPIRSIGTVQDITERKQAEELLEKSRKQYRDIAENSVLGMAVYIPGRPLVFANKRLSEITGYSLEEITSPHFNFMVLFAEEDRQLIIANIKRRLAGENVQPYESMLIPRTGDHKWVRIYNINTEYEGESTIQVQLLDITERKRAEDALRKSEESYRYLFDNANDLIQSVAPDGHFLYVNKAWQQVLGYSEEEIPHLQVWDIIHPDSMEHCMEIFQKVMSGEAASNVETVFMAKDGSPISIEGNAHCRFEDGKPIATQGIFRDVTERKRAEEELNKLYKEVKALNLELEEKVRERTRQLEESVQVAEVANRAKSEFLANMSHELRTPLNAVIGFSQVLQEQYFGKLNEKQAEYVNDILESGQHLLALINDILDLSKIEAGKMELELSKVKIKDLLEGSLVMIKEKALVHGISLDIHTARDLENLEIMADERKLKQVMFNLLSNAAKFTPDGGAIRVEGKKEKKELIISVSDTGIGIAPDDQEKIFREFYQVKGTIVDKTPGTGLGLPLSKNIIEMHGGRIWIESEGQGKGSRFTFTLPI